MKKIISILFLLFLVSCWEKNINNEISTWKTEINNKILSENNFINKKLNETIELTSMDFTVLSYKEAKETPYVKVIDAQIKAREGAKLIIAEVKAKNKLNEPFYEKFSDIFLQDNNWIKYKNTDCTISVENCFSKNLQPWLDEVWFLIYEVPENTKDYWIIINKSWTDEIYFIKN